MSVHLFCAVSLQYAASNAPTARSAACLIISRSEKKEKPVLRVLSDKKTQSGVFKVTDLPLIELRTIIVKHIADGLVTLRFKSGDVFLSDIANRETAERFLKIVVALRKGVSTLTAKNLRTPLPLIQHDGLTTLKYNYIQTKTSEGFVDVSETSFPPLFELCIHPVITDMEKLYYYNCPDIVYEQFSGAFLCACCRMLMLNMSSCVNELDREVVAGFLINEEVVYQRRVCTKSTCRKAAGSWEGPRSSRQLLALQEPTGESVSAQSQLTSGSRTNALATSQNEQATFDAESLLDMYS